MILVKFQGDTSSMQKMEKDMNGRFSKITKRFGQGLQKAGKMLKFSAFAGIATSLITQIINPLQEINSALDNILAKSGNIKDQADAMNTNVGFYAALQSAAAAKGIDQAQFNMMGQRVMELIGEAKNGNENVLSKYKDETDMGRALYKIVDALHKMPAGAKRTAIASEIFGGRVTGRMAGLLNSGFNEPLSDVMGNVNLQELSNAITSLDQKSNLQSAMRANLALRELVAKDKYISNKTIITQNKYESGQIKSENEKLKKYENIATLSVANQTLMRELFQVVVNNMPVLAIGVQGLVEILKGYNGVFSSLERLNKKEKTESDRGR